jgi:addiction module HigA family antidote
MPMKNPPHPGDFIRTEIIEPAGLSVTAAAAALRISRPALSSLLNGKADLSGEWRYASRKRSESRWTRL